MLNRRSLLFVAAFSLALTTFCAGTALAAGCRQPGDKQLRSSHGGAVYSREVTRQGYDFAELLVACSTAYGRRVELGLYGQSLDGESGWSWVKVNRRYVAWVDGAGSNASTGYTDDALTVVDLKTGKRTYSTAFSMADDVDLQYVEALALAPKGAVAWMLGNYSGGGGGVMYRDVYLHDRKGRRRLARGKRIVPGFLQFVDGGRSIRWSNDYETAPVR